MGVKNRLGWLVLPFLFVVRSAFSAEVYLWYDGSQPRKVYLNRGLLAEFDKLSKNGSSRVKKVYPRSELQLKQDEKVKIWKLPKHLNALSAVDSLSEYERRSVRPPTQYSPVFEDGERGTGRMRALPGGIIITLNSEWSEQKVQEWIAEKNLKVLKRMENNPHVFLIESPAGLTSLRTANNLYLSGEVVAASPNWWKESVKK